jgi:vancomycin resistance protein VanJ
VLDELKQANQEIGRKELKQLLISIEEQKLPLVLAGDFNFSDRSREYAWLTTSLVDAYDRSGEDQGFTWPVGHPFPHRPFVRIDYLFHSSHFQPYSAQLARNTGSDHLPLFVEIALEI